MGWKSLEGLLSEYKCTHIDDGTPKYYLYVDMDGNWYIAKEVLTGTETVFTFAKGYTDSLVSWAGRAALTYGYWDVVF